MERSLRETLLLTSAPWEMVSEHAFPSSAKSAERIEGAIIAAGAISEAQVSLIIWIRS